jgi:hypothetical protein
MTDQDVFVIGIDGGTESIRVGLFDLEGNLILARQKGLRDPIPPIRLGGTGAGGLVGRPADGNGDVVERFGSGPGSHQGDRIGRYLLYGGFS